jgi:general secretion pathway protein J
MSAKFQSTQQGGFTLVELLLAITLMAMLLGFAYSGLSAATKATSKGREILEETGNVRATHQFIRRQLNQMQPLAYDIADEAAQTTVVFEGGPRRIQFVAPMPGYLGQGGPQVQYLELVNGDDGLDLIFSHQLLQGYDPAFMVVREPIILVEGIESGQFEFLAVDEFREPLAWVTSWDTPDVLPTAVRLDIEFKKERRSIWPLLITGVKSDVTAGPANFSNSAYSGVMSSLLNRAREEPE